MNIQIISVIFANSSYGFVNVTFLFAIFVLFVILCFYIYFYVKHYKRPKPSLYLNQFEKIRKEEGNEAADLAFEKDVLREDGYMYSSKTQGNIRKYIALYADEIYLKIYVENSIWIDEAVMYENVSFQRYKVFIDAVFNRKELKGYLSKKKLYTLASPEKIAYYEEVQKKDLYK